MESIIHDLKKSEKQAMRESGLCSLDRSAAVALVILLFVLLTNAALLAVAYIPVNLGNVEETERGTSLYYHNNRIDQLWYGTDRWAVRFDINRYTTQADTLTLQKVRVYFPQESGRCNLRIYTDSMQPLNNLAAEREITNVTKGWNEISLPPEEYITGSFFWIVVEYDTDINFERYMAASAVGGNNSYFWVPENEGARGHFANMAENNSMTEFLVTVSGKLNIEGIDLELVSFSLGGDIEPGGSVHPVLEIKNNSSEMINDERIGLTLSLIDPTESVSFRSVPIRLTISPQETIVLPVTGYRATLADTPAEYRIVATLTYEEDKFTDNNVARYSFNTFPHEYRMSLLENFVRPNHTPSSNIQNEQSELTGYNFRQLNHFFHPGDRPHYSIDAAIRRDFYGLTGYPFTIVNGIKSIAGHTGAYQEILDLMMEETTASNTFVTFAVRSERLEISGSDMLMSLAFTLRNTSSFPLQTTLDNIKLYIALTEKDVPGTVGNNLLYLYRYPYALTLGYINSYRPEWKLSLQTVETIERPLNADNLQHFEIIYWVQDIQTKKIYIVGSFNLEQFDLNIEDEFLQPEPFDISIYPNPFSGRENVAIQLTGTEVNEQSFTVIEIYDIRGRLVNSIGSDTDQGNSSLNTAGGSVFWDGRNSSGLDVPTGIYFLKIQTERTGNAGKSSLPVRYKRLSVIR